MHTYIKMRKMMTTTTTTLTHDTNTSFASTPEAAQPRSPWHSPVPYLFGGLAAMLGLIAFALLILACSYWKLSRDDTQQQQQSNNEGNNDLEKGDEVSKVNGVPVFEEKIVVIMAGNDKPTFLATPSLMLINSNKNTNFEHDHVVVSSDDIANKDDDPTKESSSVSHDDDDHDHDHNHNDDDEKDEEDETTHPPPHN